MKKTFFFHILVFFTVWTVSLAAQESLEPAFSEIVDFSITMEDIREHYSRGEMREDSLTDKVVIIDGAVSSIQVLDENPETFLAELVIVNGEWHGPEEVEMYSCVVRIAGEEYAERIPARRRRRGEEPENLIKTNSRILVAGKIIGTKETLLGGNTAILDSYYVRNID
jgi:hypothetical protein